ncbi:MAG: hypothetical protein ACI855_001040 [Myxococcota bacterium]
MVASLWTSCMGRDVHRYFQRLHATRAELSPTGASALMIRHKLVRAYTVMGEVSKAEVEIERGLQTFDQTTPLYADFLLASQWLAVRRGPDEALLARSQSTLALVERHGDPFDVFDGGYHAIGGPCSTGTHLSACRGTSDSVV